MEENFGIFNYSGNTNFSITQILQQGLEINFLDIITSRKNKNTSLYSKFGANIVLNWTK